MHEGKADQPDESGDGEASGKDHVAGSDAALRAVPVVDLVGAGSGRGLAPLRVRLWSRNGRDWSSEFVAITSAMRDLPFNRVMLDGEAVAHCLDGLPHFHRLLGDGQASACLYAFDLLWFEAQDLRSVELIGRRRMLQKALKKAGPALRFSEHLEGVDGEAMFRHACALGLEGIVSKKLMSRYSRAPARAG